MDVHNVARRAMFELCSLIFILHKEVTAATNGSSTILGLGYKLGVSCCKEGGVHPLFISAISFKFIFMGTNLTHLSLVWCTIGVLLIGVPFVTLVYQQRAINVPLVYQCTPRCPARLFCFVFDVFRTSVPP